MGNHSLESCQPFHHEHPDGWCELDNCRWSRINDAIWQTHPWWPNRWCQGKHNQSWPYPLYFLGQGKDKQRLCWVYMKFCFCFHDQLDCRWTWKLKKLKRILLYHEGSRICTTVIINGSSNTSATIHPFRICSWKGSPLSLARKLPHLTLGVIWISTKSKLLLTTFIELVGLR